MIGLIVASTVSGVACVGMALICMGLEAYTDFRVSKYTLDILLWTGATCALIAVMAMLLTGGNLVFEF